MAEFEGALRQHAGFRHDGQPDMLSAYINAECDGLFIPGTAIQELNRKRLPGNHLAFFVLQQLSDGSGRARHEWLPVFVDDEHDHHVFLLLWSGFPSLMLKPLGAPG